MDKYLNTQKPLPVKKNIGYFKKGVDYALRVTGVSVSKATEILLKLSDRFVVGEEGNYQGVSLHIHAVLTPWLKDVKEMRKQVKEAFNVTPQDYSFTKLRKSGCQAVRYAVKRGDKQFIALHNVDDKKFDLSWKMAHGKGRAGFKKDYEDLKERFYQKHISRYCFYKSLCKLKAQYNQNIYAHHIKAQCITVYMRQDEKYFNEWVDHQWEMAGLMTMDETRKWNDERYN